PRVVSASVLRQPDDHLGRVAIVFSEDMDSATATDLAHYRLSVGSIMSASQSPDFPRVIILRTPPPGCGTYQLVITGVKDDSGRLLNPNPAIVTLATVDLDFCNQAYTLDLPAGYSLVANQLSRGENKLSEVLPEVPALTTVSLLASNQTLETYTFGPA